MPRERAALARAILIFVVGLAAAGLLIGVLNEPFGALSSASADIATSQQAARGRGYMTAFWDGLPVIIVLLSLLQLLGAAAAEGRLPGQ